MIASMDKSESHGNTFSKAFMDDDEVAEIETFPYVDCVYYDPWEKKLKVDEQMLAVEVDTSWNLEESKRHTIGRWVTRLEELEDKGMFTAKTAAKVGADGDGQALVASNSRSSSPVAHLAPGTEVNVYEEEPQDGEPGEDA